MENELFDFLWISQYRGVYDGSSTVRHRRRSGLSDLLGNSGNLFLYSIFSRSGLWRAYTTLLLVLLVVGSGVMISLGIIGFISEKFMRRSGDAPDI